MGYVQSFKQKFPDKIEPEMMEAFHGSKNKIEEFSIDNASGSEDEFSGIFFSSKENTARKKGPYVTKVQLDMNRTVSTQSPPRRTDIVFMVTHAPNKDESLKKYGENPREAYFKATDFIYKGKNARECFHRVYTEFYKDNIKEFVNNMMKCEYDGMKVERSDESHYIVFNPKTITIVKQ